LFDRFADAAKRRSPSPPALEAAAPLAVVTRVMLREHRALRSPAIQAYSVELNEC
jgi:hypothetical protein